MVLYTVSTGSIWSLDGSKSVSGKFTKSLIKDIPEVSETEIAMYGTSIHEHSFKDFGKNAYPIAISLGIALGNHLLGIGAKEILKEVKETM